MKLIRFVTLALAVLAIEGRSTGRLEPEKNEYFDKSLPNTETTLNAEDFENANKLPDASTRVKNADATAMQNPNMFEGDIANKGLNKTTIYAFLGKSNPSDSSGIMRNAIKGSYARWPNAVIPYTVSSQFTNTGRAIIADAMNQFAQKSCIKFIPRTNQVDYVRIIVDNGCYSLVGKNRGAQPLSLGKGCVERGVVMHELMHAVGFFHEQSREDRDKYVEVLYQNIQTGAADQFDKEPSDYLGQSYDYKSIMHYGPRFFSKNGQDTLRPVASARNAGIKLSDRHTGFSDTDIKELNIIAQCSGGV